jgi:3-oxoacyl-[acyl-carrier protein] reductase
MKRLHERVAVVTGAGQGIGEAIARRFAAEGARVVGLDRNAETVRKVCGALPGAVAHAVDVVDHAALGRVVAETLEKFGRIDVLVNNAAICHYVPLVDMTLEQWRQMVAVDLEAYFALAQLVARAMISKGGGGRIINVASTQAIACESTVGAYAAAKGGVLALTRCLAVELAANKILVNALVPGCIHTPMSFVNGVDETTTELFQEWYVRRRKIPLGRPGEPEEVAGAALFLASDDSSYMTGQMLVIDGGLTITF